jgi:hypothetical protein
MQQVGFYRSSRTWKLNAEMALQRPPICAIIVSSFAAVVSPECQSASYLDEPAEFAGGSIRRVPGYRSKLIARKNGIRIVSPQFGIYKPRSIAFPIGRLKMVPRTWIEISWPCTSMTSS